jgi:hypothetical protein
VQTKTKEHEDDNKHEHTKDYDGKPKKMIITNKITRIMLKIIGNMNA